MHWPSRRIVLLEFGLLFMFSFLFTLYLIRSNSGFLHDFIGSHDRKIDTCYPGLENRTSLLRGSSRTQQPLKRYLHDWFPNETFPPFQPEIVDDFPTSNTIPRIPHILHQTYANYEIADYLSPYVKRLTEKHPNWTYYFWTDQSARKLIEDYYPTLLSNWDRYQRGIIKGDALRYVVLYHFGGVYLDLDIDILRPLDRVTTKYSCIIASEPIEHSVFLFNTHIYLTNAIMFSRPKHPFMKLMLDTLHEHCENGHLFDIAGPGLVTRAFYTYNGIDFQDENRTKTHNDSNAPYFHKGELPESHEDAVYIPNTQYFNDDIDTSQQNGFEKTCNKDNFPGQSYLFKRACMDMKRRGSIRNNVSKFKFVKHTWDHSYGRPREFRKGIRRVDIRNVVKTCIIYGVTTVSHET